MIKSTIRNINHNLVKFLNFKLNKINNVKLIY